MYISVCCVVWMLSLKVPPIAWHGLMVGKVGSWEQGGRHTYVHTWLSTKDFAGRAQNAQM